MNPVLREWLARAPSTISSQFACSPAAPKDRLARWKVSSAAR